MTQLSRRQWLQTSLLASTALLVSGSTSAAIQPSKKNSVKLNDDLIRLHFNENP